MYFFKVLGGGFVFQSEMSFSGSQIPLKSPAALLYHWKYLMLSLKNVYIYSGVGEMVQLSQEDLGSFPSIIMAAHSGL